MLGFSSGYAAVLVPVDATVFKSVVDRSLAPEYFCDAIEICLEEMNESEPM